MSSATEGSMPTALRVVVALPGVLFLFQALNWHLDPEGSAAGLGMPLLEGIGRSTQVGDLSAFFLALSTFILLGAWTRKAHWLQAATLLIGGAAVMRTLAFLVAGADFAAQFIAIEAVIAGLLAYASTRAES